MVATYIPHNLYFYCALNYILHPLSNVVNSCKSAHLHISIWTAFIIVVSTFLLSGCWNRTYVPARNYDFSTTYTPDKTKAMPRYAVYNLNDSVSRLYFTVKSSDLLYSRSNINNQLTANILVQYVLRSIDQPKIIADSGHVIMNDVNESGVLKQLAGYTDFDIPADGNYFLEVSLRDLNKMTVNYELITLSHTDDESYNNFLLTAPESETPLFRNYVGKDETFSVRHTRKDVVKLHVAYYRNTSEAARPPYAMPVVTPEILPDSTWTIDVDPNVVHQFPMEGYYRLTMSEAEKGGFTVCRFPDDFPKITTPDALLEPMRYITTKKEYTTLQTSKNIKHSVDSFWISTGGSQDRARELISAYYGRVEIANIHFSSHIEGWKTDRGMVYIIYGEPQNVYRTPTSETWVYGQDQGGNMLNFVFERNTNSGAPNDFTMQRNQVYNISWITAVDYWKQGQVYRAR